MHSDKWLGDPLVIDPTDFDQKAGWQECREYVDRCGGLAHPDGEPNWRAAAGADPGVCSRPLCGAMYWAWGRVQQCRECGFRYPTDWWGMFSYGAQAAARGDSLDNHKGGWRQFWETRYAHKYFRWAYERKAEPSMEAARAVAWDREFPEDAGEMRARTAP